MTSSNFTAIYIYIVEQQYILKQKKNEDFITDESKVVLGEVFKQPQTKLLLVELQLPLKNLISP